MSTSWHSYPKVYNLGHAAISELLNGNVIVEEKIDGSQFSFGVFDGVLRAKSHRNEIILDAPEKMFAIAVETVKKLKPKLVSGYTYRAEYLMKQKHNTLAYGRVPKKNLIIFDINRAEEDYLSYKEKLKVAMDLGLDCVPILDSGKIDGSAGIEKLLEKESMLGGTKIEGVVIKNYDKFDRGGKVLMGKYVSEKFKEVHDEDWKKRHLGKADIMIALGKKYNTDARLNKAIQHLREDGKYEGTPRDIGNLIKYIQCDLKDECEQEIKDSLFRWAFPQIQRIALKGMPEKYKKILMEKQFENK